MKRVLLSLLAIVLIVGLLGAAGFAGYQFGLRPGVCSTRLWHDATRWHDDGLWLFWSLDVPAANRILGTGDLGNLYAHHTQWLASDASGNPACSCLTCFCN